MAEINYVENVQHNGMFETNIFVGSLHKLKLEIMFTDWNLATTMFVINEFNCVHITVPNLIIA
jgi:hypothetical protein